MQKKIETITVREAAGLLGMSISTINRYIKEGILEARQAFYGARWRVVKSSVESLLKELQG